MTYENIVEARFIDRPNRFIAHVELEGKTVVCHVKNTGRCRELLVPGAKVILQPSDKPGRKTVAKANFCSGRYTDDIAVLRRG